MKTDEIQKMTYYYGNFAATTMLHGIIQPDMKMSNIGISDWGMVFNDFAEAAKIKIPEKLTAETLRRLSRSILPLFDCFPDYKTKSYLRAGFIARGGLLADIILHECMKKDFGSLMFFEGSLNKPITDYDAIECINRPNIEQALREWRSFPTEKAVETNLYNIGVYGNSSERNNISAFNRYYLDRYFYNRSYMEIPDNQYPSLLANAGCSAFKHDRKYRAYGLLKKALPLLNGQWKPLSKICKTCFNTTVHMKKLNLEVRTFIDEHINMDYFELTWILDDFDLMFS